MGSMLPLTAILNPSGGEQESSFTPRPSPSTAINFYPFEDLGEASVREIRKYQIHNFGRIRDSCRRIPYNTGKRDFYEKTGRTCFEVFQYDFKIAGSDTTWTVMWDYKIGLVRTTPFFKCCDYSKTISAKMLNQNPGLRDISHSITGGAIRAQGYWMPFECARAVCATFCYPIAGALIPLFGPKFPSECIPPNTQHYARMTISPAIIQRSKREAEEFRRLYGNMPSPPTHSLPSSTRTTHGHASYRAVGASPALAYHHHHGGWQTGTDSDVEGSSLDRFPRLPPLQTAHLPTPVLSSAESSYNASSTAQSSPRFWTAVDHPRDTRAPVYPPQYSSSYGQHEWHSKGRYHHLEPDPYRSAVSSPPTSSGTSHHQFYHQPVLPLPSSTTREAPPPARESQRQVLPPYRPPGGTAFRAVNSSSSFSPSHRHGDSKRPFDDYYDHDYDAGESANGSSPEAPSPKVFHGSSSSKAQVQVQVQSQSNLRHSKPVEARRCSLGVVAAGSDTSSLGRGGKNTSSSSKESDRTTSESEEERDRDARRRALVDRSNSTLAPMVGGGVYQPQPRRDSSGRSSPKSPHTKNDRTTSGAAATRSDDGDKTKRTPSFSGAERVAALTLLHLGILDKEKKEHAHTNSKDHSSSRQQQSQAAAAAARGSSSPPREVEKSHGRSPRPPPRHDDTHTPYPYGETIYAIPSRRTPKESYTTEEVSESTTTTTTTTTAHAHASSIPRRGSRDRKRRKGRSI